MRKDFLDLYEAELRHLYERAEVFAAEFPGLADSLGGLVRDRMDPGLTGLLEGAAYLAARVRLRIDREFPVFTEALAERLMPGYLAPIPSAVLLQATPDFARSDLAEGRQFAARSLLEAAYRQRDRRVVCRFRLAADLELWPLAIDRGDYLTSPTRLQALGLDAAPDDTGAGGASGGLRLRVVRRTGPEAPDPNEEQTAGRGAPVAELAAAGLDRLRVQLHGPLSETVALYEQIFGGLRRLTLRWLDQAARPHFATVPVSALEQIGFEPEEGFVPEETRLFAGLALLRDHHILPQKFLGFRLSGLRRILAGIDAPAFDLLFEFDRVEPRLAALVKAETFRLHAVPAVNLFPETCARIAIGPERRENLVMPQSSPPSSYEIHSVLDVQAQDGPNRPWVSVWPLHSLSPEARDPAGTLHFGLRRRLREPDLAELRQGRMEDYAGTETLIALHEPAGMAERDRVTALQVRALCTNRHLPRHLPVGGARADFHLLADVTLPLVCLSGPTAPRLSLAEQERPGPAGSGGGSGGGSGSGSGGRLWRLINLMALNLQGLLDRGAPDAPGGTRGTGSPGTGTGTGEAAAGLREVLDLFTDFTDPAAVRQLQGLRGASLRPVTRLIRRAEGNAPARGLEVTLEFDERAFEGSGIALLGAVLDRFLADHVQLNSFTQTVIRSTSRGEVLRFAPRSGTGPVL